MQCLKLVTNVRLFMNSMLSLASLVQHPFLDYATQLKIQNQLMEQKLHLECQEIAIQLRLEQRLSPLEASNEALCQELALLYRNSNAKTALSFRHVMLGTQVQQMCGVGDKGCRYHVTTALALQIPLPIRFLAQRTCTWMTVVCRETMECFAKTQMQGIIRTESSLLQHITSWTIMTT